MMRLDRYTMHNRHIRCLCAECTELRDFHYGVTPIQLPAIVEQDLQDLEKRKQKEAARHRAQVRIASWCLDVVVFLWLLGFCLTTKNPTLFSNLAGYFDVLILVGSCGTAIYQLAADENGW